MSTQGRAFVPKGEPRTRPCASIKGADICLVPEGRNDRSQAIYCLVSDEKGNRPVGNGVIGSDRRATTGTSNQAWVRIRPSPTGRILDWTHSRQSAAAGCLATIIRPLRDKRPGHPIGTSPHSPTGQKMRRLCYRRILQLKTVLGD